jgi:ankyrin repeat protein
VPPSAKELLLALFQAVEADLPLLAELILEAGARLEGQTDGKGTWRSGFTPLEVAAKCGSAGVLKLLLAKGARLAQQDWTPLHDACLGGEKVGRDFGYEECARLLLERYRKEGAARFKKELEREASPGKGGRPLLLAAQVGHLGIVRLLLDAGAKVDSQNDTLHTPLHFACKNGHPALIPILLAAGANREHPNCNNQTPLHHAAFEKQHQCCAALVEAGANADCHDYLGNTPLMIALGHDLVPSVRVLAPVSKLGSFNRMGQTALHVAAIASRNGAVMAAVLEHAKPGEVNARSAGGRSARDGSKQAAGSTPLHYALEKGNIETAKLLLKAGADCEAVDDQGTTLLISAVRGDDLACVRLILGGHGAYKLTPAQVNAQVMGDGPSGLHLAALQGNTRICAALIAAGARIDLTARVGDKSMTPHDFAIAQALRGALPGMQSLYMPQASGSGLPAALVGILTTQASELDLLSILGEGPAAAPACAKCSKREDASTKLNLCAGCRQLLYCGTQCQKAHWGAHKQECKRRQAELAAKKAEEQRLIHDDGMAGASVETIAKLRAEMEALMRGGA